MQYSMPRTSFHLTVGQSFLPSPGVPPIVATGQSSLLHQMQPVGTSPYGQFAVVPSSPSTSAIYATGQSSYFPPSQQTYRYTEPMTTPLDHKPFAAHRAAINQNPTMDQKPFAAWRTSGVSPVSPHQPLPPSHVPVPPGFGYMFQPSQGVSASGVLHQERSYGTPVESARSRSSPSRSHLPASPGDPLSKSGLPRTRDSPQSWMKDSLKNLGPKGQFQENISTDVREDIEQCFPGLKNEEVERVKLEQEEMMNLMAEKNADLMKTEGALQEDVCKHNAVLKELNKARVEMAQLRVENEEMKRELDKLQDEITTIRERECALREQNNVMVAELHGAKVELTSILQEREENIIILTKLTEALKVEQGSKELSEQRNKELQGQLQKVKEATEEEHDRSFLESEVANMRKECQRMTKVKERSDMKIEYELNLQLVRKEIDVIRKELDGVRGERSTLIELEFTKLRQEFQSLKRENILSLEVVRNEMYALRSEFDGMKGLSSKCQIQVAEREQEGNDIGSESQGVFRSELQ